MTGNLHENLHKFIARWIHLRMRYISKKEGVEKIKTHILCSVNFFPFKICTADGMLLRCSNWEEWDGRGIYHVWGKGSVYRVSVWKHKEKKPLVRPWHWREDNNKMDLQEVGFGDVDCIDLAQDRDRWRALVNAVMNHITHPNYSYFLLQPIPIPPLYHHLNSTLTIFNCDILLCKK